MNLREVSAQCPAHLTGADLYALCSEAMLVALRRTVEQLEEGRGGGGGGRGGGGGGRRGGEEEEGKGGGEGEEVLLEVTREDFFSSLSNLTPSVTESELDRYRDFRQ